MSDSKGLVERLRFNSVNPTDIASQAADEIERLTNLTKNTSDGTTHSEGCWGWGPKHYDCAVAEIERLQKALIELMDAERCGDKARWLAQWDKVPTLLGSHYEPEPNPSNTAR